MLVNLNEVLKKAQAEHYGVGLFNTVDSEMLQAAIEAAEELSSPIIIGTAEVLLPYGELKLIAPSIIAMAKQAKVPVVVHYDHGLTFQRCLEALHLGFSSIMYDASAKTYEQNVSETAELVRIAHGFGATVEGEIGHVGEAVNGDNATDKMYTTVEAAKDFAARTGVDALAVAIGTAHGVYKIKPKLNIQRLKEIRSAVNVPLVLHGGSGLSDDDFKNTIAAGIAKINVFTDLCLAGEKAMKEGIAAEENYLQIRNSKKDAIKEAIKVKMRLFDSQGKA
ncbi:MAG: class II fructose-bisphosphate aldolase [Bacilli bacterium]|jgi:fructose-bisphosphate aldolase class II|nr:class II fructose-bisphosphate aldolase [Bacilli bacterium]